MNFIRNYDFSVIELPDGAKAWGCDTKISVRDSSGEVLAIFEQC